MNPQEYARMHALETDYWWFAGRRAIIASLLRVAGDARANTPAAQSAHSFEGTSARENAGALETAHSLDNTKSPGSANARHMSTHVAAPPQQTLQPPLQPPLELLDIGCGTGANLPLLLHFVGPRGRVTGLDFSLLALRFAHDFLAQNAPATSADVTSASATTVAAAENSAIAFADDARATGEKTTMRRAAANGAFDDGSLNRVVSVTHSKGAWAFDNASVCDAKTMGAWDDVERSSAAVRVSLLRGDALRLPFPDASFDFVTMLDVLEHLSDDRRALCEVRRVLRPGGALVWSVPAYQKLWSAHDEALHHFRRYESRALRRLMRQSGFDIQLLSFAMSLMPPLAWLWRRLVLPFQPRRPRHAKRHSEGAVLPSVPPLLNRALVSYLALEGRVLARRPLRFGTSLVGIARKKNG